MRIILLLNSILILRQVVSWNYIGHNIVASLAESIISDKARLLIDVIFQNNNITNSSIVSVSSWPDKAAYQDEYKWSYPMHGLAIQDNPPFNCSEFSLDRDCLNKICLYTALLNYTTRLIYMNNLELNYHESFLALKFVIHFVGDIHCPVHVTGRDKHSKLSIGYWNNKQTNLHKIWDGYILQKSVLKLNGENEYYNYMHSKYQNISDNERSLLLGCKFLVDIQPIHMYTYDYVESNLNYCLQKWTTETNRVNCVYTYNNEYTNSTFNRQLEQNYYESVYLEVDRLLLVAGIRLGALLEFSSIINSLFPKLKLENNNTYDIMMSVSIIRY